MVNILISTYNGGAYIEEQLDSILAQNYSDYRIYIRDDGSRDDTLSVIEKYIRNHPCEEPISLIRGENIGFCKSFFTLLAEASEGDYWAFCDQDDVWYSDKLRLAVEWMEQQKQDIPLLYHSGFEIGNGDLSVRTPYENPTFSYEFYNSITSNIFFGFAVTINKTLRDYLLLANPEEIKYHDWFGAMITAAFGKYHLSSRIEAVHRQHEENSSPLYFWKKIPHGMKLLFGDRFYNRQAREFMRLFGEQLKEEDREILSWFTMEHYSFTLACRKAFYTRRWNPKVSVELVLRGLMLFGQL